MGILRYLDVGCKHGGALDVARGKRGRNRGLPSAHPSTCLGIDKNSSYESSVCKRGYQFQCVKLPDTAFKWPEVDVCLGWNVMEHFENVEEAKQILCQMIEAAQVAVWLLLPSFEADTKQVLQARGFDLPWTSWGHHRAFVQKKHVYEVVNSYQKVKKVEERPKWPITRCGPDKFRVLKDKKQIPGPINPPLAGAWDMLLRMK